MWVVLLGLVAGWVWCLLVGVVAGGDSPWHWPSVFAAPCLASSLRDLGLWWVVPCWPQPGGDPWCVKV